MHETSIGAGMSNPHAFASDQVVCPFQETSEAIRAWHRGAPLTERQRALIDQARIECLARAHGVDLRPVIRDGMGNENRFFEGREY